MVKKKPSIDKSPTIIGSNNTSINAESSPQSTFQVGDGNVYNQHLHQENEYNVKRLSALLKRVRLEISYNMQPHVGCVANKFKIVEQRDLLDFLKKIGERNDIIETLKNLIEVAEACNLYAPYPPKSSSTPGIVKNLSKTLDISLEGYELYQKTA